MKRTSVAVIGAGVAGLACARRLAPTCDVRLFDKGRSAGGRLSTRRVQTLQGEASFDHGAQYIVAREPDFCRLMETFGSIGAAAEWNPDTTASPRGLSTVSDGKRWVGVPGMSALAREMAQGLLVETSSRVARVSRGRKGWRLDLERDGQPEPVCAGPFDAVVCAVPAEQAAPILAPIDPDFAAEAAAANTAPCWAGLMVFDRRLSAPFSAIRLRDGEALSWIARETSKPGRSGPEAWVVHASQEWSRLHLELSPEEVIERVWRSFRDAVDDAPAPLWMKAHRWRYAMVEKPAATPFAWNATTRLGVCGDWRIGARVEAAWVSGTGLAEAMLA